MKYIRPTSLVKLITMLWRIIITTAAATIFYNVYLTFYDEASFFYRGNYVVVLLYVALLVLFIGMYGGYSIEYRRWRELLFSYFFGVLITNAAMYLVLIMIALQILNIVPLLCVLALQLIIGAVLYMLCEYAHKNMTPRKKALAVISNDAHDLNMLAKITASMPCDIVQTMYEDQSEEDIIRALDRCGALIVGQIDGSLRERLGGHCYDSKKNVIYIPSMHDIIFRNTTRVSTDDSIVYITGRHGFTTEQLIAKRIGDILISALGLIVASPFMLIAALLIKLQDGGPVLFKQQRLTRNGKIFMLYKFRSMIIDAEKGSGARLAGKNDSRITPVGKFIRATRIDELPQLINILKGDMSLVGPRPERPELFGEICEEYPEFRFRLKVKAGLTGYAQLYGKYNTTFEDKARMDVLYIERASLIQDLHLLMYTVKVIFMSESTEGVDEKPVSDEEKTENMVT